MTAIEMELAHPTVRGTSIAAFAAAIEPRLREGLGVLDDLPLDDPAATAGRLRSWIASGGRCAFDGSIATPQSPAGCRAIDIVVTRSIVTPVLQML